MDTPVRVPAFFACDCRNGCPRCIQWYGLFYYTCQDCGASFDNLEDKFRHVQEHVAADQSQDWTI